MKVQRLNELLSGIENPLERKPCLELALAVETAYKLELPATPVDSIVVHFEQYHADTVKRIIGDVNELFPVAVMVTYNLIIDVYRTRYCLCHNPRALNSEQIRSILNNDVMVTTMTPEHKDALVNCDKSTLLRKDLSEYLCRFITDKTPSA